MTFSLSDNGLLIATTAIALLLVVVARRNVVQVRRVQAMVLALFIDYWKTHRETAKFFGVHFESSDVWETSRDESGLLDSFSLIVIRQFFGTKAVIGDPDFIKDLKQRQRQMVRPLDIVGHLLPLAGQRITAQTLENELVRVWTLEMTAAYGITPPDDPAAFNTAILMVRTFLNRMLVAPMSGLWWGFKNWKQLKPVYVYYRSVPFLDASIMFATYLTTIDTTLINLLITPNTKSFHEMFELSPVKTVAMFDKTRGLVILDVKANDSDSPGNSAFGPKGVICPGNLITSAVLKEVQRLQSIISFDLPPESPKPVLNTSDLLVTIGNRSEVIIEPKLQ